MEETPIFICQCHSFDHILKFYKDEWGDVYTSVHLVPDRSLLKRVKTAIKYVFGFRGRFGDFDEFVFKENDLKALKEFLYNKK